MRIIQQQGPRVITTFESAEELNNENIEKFNQLMKGKKNFFSLKKLTLIIPTFSFFSEDCDFSGFFKPTKALIHFPETPIALVTLAPQNTDLQDENS